MAVEIRETLQNGFKVQIIQRDFFNINGPRVFCELIAQAGASSDPPDKRGLAHIVEHMVRRKLRQVVPLFPPTLRRAFNSKKKAFVYGEAQTELDITRYRMRTEWELLPDTFAFIAKLLKSVPFSEVFIRRCIDEVSREIRGLQRNNPLFPAYHTLYRTAFHGHPYEFYTFGQPSDFSNVRVDDCKNFFRAYYRPENLFLCCAGSTGNFSSPDLLLKTAESTLGRFQPLQHTGKRSPSRSNHRLASATVHATGFQAHIDKIIGKRRPTLLIGTRTPSLTSTERAKLALLTELITGTRSKIRRKLGNVLDELTGFSSLAVGPSLFEVSFVFSNIAAPQHVVVALKYFLKTCRRLTNAGPEQTEFNRAKRIALERILNPIPERAARHRIEFFSLFAFEESRGKNGLRPADTIKIIRSVSRKQLIEFSRAILNPAKMTCVCRIPAKHFPSPNSFKRKVLR